MSSGLRMLPSPPRNSGSPRVTPIPSSALASPWSYRKALTEQEPSINTNTTPGKGKGKGKDREAAPRLWSFSLAAQEGEVEQTRQRALRAVRAKAEQEAQAARPRVAVPNIDRLGKKTQAGHRTWSAEHTRNPIAELLENSTEDCPSNYYGPPIGYGGLFITHRSPYGAESVSQHGKMEVPRPALYVNCVAAMCETCRPGAAEQMLQYSLAQYYSARQQAINGNAPLGGIPFRMPDWSAGPSRATNISTLASEYDGRPPSIPPGLSRSCATNSVFASPKPKMSSRLEREPMTPLSPTKSERIFENGWEVYVIDAPVVSVRRSPPQVSLRKLEKSALREV